jgi:hypothetical protein
VRRIGIALDNLRLAANALGRAVAAGAAGRLFVHLDQLRKIHIASESLILGLKIGAMPVRGELDVTGTEGRAEIMSLCCCYGRQPTT